jgi:ankyrin repeat protein
LIERGAEVEAACKLYGGGARTLGLMLTSAFPRAAGVDGELVRVLARGGAQVTGRHGGSGDSPLATAILHGAPRAAEALAEAGAPVDSVFAAAGLDRVEALAQMMAAGADVNERFAGGATALHAAAAMGYARAAEYLIAHGGDPRMRDHHWGNTPAGLAKYFGHTALASRLAAAEEENSSGG